VAAAAAKSPFLLTVFSNASAILAIHSMAEHFKKKQAIYFFVNSQPGAAYIHAN
jgi:hypothetical protein